MTSWNHHHPPHDHPDFEAYLATLTEDDLAAMDANDTTISKIYNDELNSPDDF